MLNNSATTCHLLPNVLVCVLACGRSGYLEVAGFFHEMYNVRDAWHDVYHDTHYYLVSISYSNLRSF